MIEGNTTDYKKAVVDLKKNLARGEFEKLSELGLKGEDPFDKGVVEYAFLQERCLYSNIGCPKATRVEVRDDLFIHANHVKDTQGQQHFIFAMYPQLCTELDGVEGKNESLPLPIDLFYEMIEKYNPTIVNLAEQNRLSNPKLSLHEYWPKRKIDYQTKDQKITVTCLEVIPKNENDTNLLIRLFELEEISNGKQHFKMLHLQNWPDKGVIEPKRLLEVIDTAAKLHNGNKGPMLVHCRGGIGRTGVFGVTHTVVKRVRDRIAQGKSLGNIREEIEIEIKHFRTQRDKEIVETPEQLKLILETVALATEEAIKKQ